jgi:methylated-DNA-[protein]-cysteine S-methyltransferase
MNNNLKQLLEIYLSGDIVMRNNALDEIIDSSKISPIQKIVMIGLSDIGYGDCISYSEFALKISFQKQVRYVSTLIGKNPLPVIIPCHRVIRKNGNIGNYIFGSKIKQELIDFESRKIHKISNDSIDIIINYFDSTKNI